MVLHVEGKEGSDLVVIDAENFVEIIFDEICACRPVAEINKRLGEREASK